MLNVGAVYDFNEQGVNRSLNGWKQCLAVEMVAPNQNNIEPIWNAKLHEFIAYEDWLPNKYLSWQNKTQCSYIVITIFVFLPRYSEADKNCYDFVLGFLMLLQLESKYPCIQCRTKFCEQFLIPQSKKAAKYIGLYRKIIEENILIQYPENSTPLWYRMKLNIMHSYPMFCSKIYRNKGHIQFSLFDIVL